MKLAWSDATKMTAHAISSGRPRRCSGTSRAAWAIIAGVFQTSSTASVSVGPGATALTVIPYFAHSAPSLCRASPTSHSTARVRRPSARTRSATDSSASLRRLHATTSAPTRASSTAIARPIPWLAPVTIATRSRSVSAENDTLLDDRARRRHQARDLDLLAVDQGRDLRRDLGLPVVALVDQVVEPLALGLALESTNPDVDALVFLADEA